MLVLVVISPIRGERGHIWQADWVLSLKLSTFSQERGWFCSPEGAGSYVEDSRKQF